MSNRRPNKWLSILFVLVMLVGAACDRNDDDVSDEGNITLFMSYIPSVQFAPVYVAYERGYFRDEGISIEFENSFNEADGVDRIAINNLQFGIISGEQVILARGAEKPLVYVMEWFHRFPVGVVVPADSDIDAPADLAGRTVSLPGFQGASYVGLRALLASADLDEDDLTLQEIGFAAPEFMCSRQVEAATVYIANEPLTINDQCYDVRVIEISDYANLVSNGLVTNEQTIRDNPELVRGMVRALWNGLVDTIADPEAAFELSLKHVDLPDDQMATQRQVLLNSVELWRSDNLGTTMPEAWERTQQILLDTTLLQASLSDLPAAYTNDFLPAEPESE